MYLHRLCHLTNGRQSGPIQNLFRCGQLAAPCQLFGQYRRCLYSRFDDDHLGCIECILALEGNILIDQFLVRPVIRRLHTNTDQFTGRCIRFGPKARNDELPLQIV